MLNFVIKLFSCSSFYDLWTRQFHHTIVFVYELAVFFGSMFGIFGYSPLTWARRTSMFLFLILYIDVLFNLFMTHVLHLPCLLRPLYCPLDFLFSQCPFLVPWLYFRAVSLILEALYLLFPFLLTLRCRSLCLTFACPGFCSAFSSGIRGVDDLPGRLDELDVSGWFLQGGRELPGGGLCKAHHHGQRRGKALAETG